MTMVIGEQAMFTAQDAAARIIYVDDCPGGGEGQFMTYCTIQEAIGDANDGDTVMVYPGTYAPAPGYSYSWEGKNITVMSTSGAAVTIIDLMGSGPAFDLNSGTVTNASLIQGFTITNGSTNNAGAIRLFYASPTIVGCVFTDNAANNAGGALNMRTCNEPVSVLSCAFQGNTAGTFGGAIYMSDGTLLLNGCKLSSNSALLSGGAIHLLRSAATITSCGFNGNTTTDPTPGPLIHNGGGAICSDPANAGDLLTVVDCKFTNNTTAASSGGAIAFNAAGAGWGTTMLFVDRCEFHNNSCVNAQQAIGGAIFAYGSGVVPVPTTEVPLVKIDNSFISHNEASCTGDNENFMARGGGVGTSGGEGEYPVVGIEICNSTIADNRVTRPAMALTQVSGGGLWARDHIAIVSNSIFWENYAYDIGNQIAASYQLDVAFCDVDETGDASCPLSLPGVAASNQDCDPGTHINADPGFADAPNWDYHITDESACWNVGDTAGGCGDYDIDLDDRVCSFRVDMGADEVCD